ncbi:ATP-dependent zinc metalloprotease FtsH [Planctomycetales bacterium 10988]|nr:ATP-dependent zinc metalloprotease FtsH [Planctomycetales bacterium 10988]
MSHNDLIEPLRQALRVSPENLPLRIHLGETLIRKGLSLEAESLCKEGLTLAPGSESLKLLLASAFMNQGKDTQALVILEELLARRDTPAKAYLLHAKLSLREGKIQAAVHSYKEAIDLEPELADDELADQLGMNPEEDDELVEGRLRHADYDEEDDDLDVTLERPDTNFADVGGMEPLKEEIRMKIIYPMQHAEMFAAYGKSIGGGILMYGPPGCGKTHLARATAGEIQAKFLNVGISDVLDMWIGQSERNLHAIFEQARSSKPCVLFFDEVDALGASRSDMRQSSGRHLINQFLSELDGVEQRNDGVLVLAATNAPWHLDSAFRRPGRFDRILFVPPPDLEARASILQVLLRGKPVGSIDLKKVAKRCGELSGADLKALVDQAVELKLQEAMKTGKLLPLSTNDLLAALKRIHPSTKDWFSTAKNYALYSNQEGLYDDILTYLKMK